MWKYILLLLNVLLVFSAFEMKGQTLLVLEKSGTVKNFKYKLGDKIAIEKSRGNLIFAGPITEIKDSSIVIDYYNEVKLCEISSIYRQRGLFRYLSGVGITAGIFYFSLDAVNGIINNDSPVIAKNTLYATGIMVGTGFLMKAFVKRKIILGEKWRLVILNFEFPG